MFLQHTILAVVVLPYVLGIHSTVLDVNNTITKKNATDNINPKFFNEGGAASPEDPLLSKGNDFLSLSKETSKIKKTSSVVRKNGVIFTQDQQEAMKIESSTSKHYNISKSKEVHKNILSTKNITNIKTLSDTKAANKTEIHKPLILSYDTLSKMDINQNKLSSVPIIQSSFKTVPDHVPSPNEGASKSYTMNPVKHPGMIMPIVITILIVPMFAVLGYMAVKRGKEAWKNRHYKRMDFLLDGMYND